MGRESRQLTLIASVGDLVRSDREVPAGYRVRPARVEDEEALAKLYLASYPEETGKDIGAARGELRRTFGGEYGRLDFEASPLVVQGPEVVAAVLTVEEGPWKHHTPPGPFIIEVMVHPDHRRRGLAQCLMGETARKLAAKERETAALRVLSDNPGALALYRRLGFEDWRDPGT